ncbi:MAG TPA: 3-oxoacyl-ACP synthase [Leptolyngbyaceae cyanobacterium M33_DOE_097]|uniref:3-oxoacyl-ACP synthase n=1 Tax=Oscillatoriales cyanobacterium SpSt-418 TaxID=2282169 RepID=A0A7C3KFX3_9CYAN|nr:3-oxoacyl-ACP synthase [Leptolyngbyaceae cyanobacterium M33_DOE_097]
MYQAFINSIGNFLPGKPIGNDELEDYLGKVNGRASKAKSRILRNNGIQWRHYALDRQQNSTHLNSQMAALAVRDVLRRADLEPRAVDLLAAGTTWADLLVPGFANMVHGELPELSPLEVMTSMGVCCAGIGALKYAASQVKLGEKTSAIAVASEQPSRLFRHTNFEAETEIQAGKMLGFDAEFLRWMLSDGAGAMLVQNQPNSSGISLQIEWIELISHANAYPVCMYAGAADESAQKSWMNYTSYVEAAQAGALNLRQNIRLLDNVIKLGVEGWLRLIEAGRVAPSEVDWLLCHYSSHFFRGQIIDLLEQAGCMIPEERWFTNLYTRGNTGCASIYLMLEELFNSGKLQPGQTIFCFVPESGRFTTAYMMLRVVERAEIAPPVPYQAPMQEPVETNQAIAPELPAVTETASAYLLRNLALIWLEFERELQSVPLIRKLNRGEFTLEDYKAMLRNLRPQVVEGARWIARAASNMTDFQLRSTFIGHAKDEHRDFQMLDRNYVSVGGQLEEMTQAEKNVGSEALSAFIFHQASRENPVDLIGSMFIIEGLGQKLAGKWAAQIKAQLGLRDEQISFLGYHAENDEAHLGKLTAIAQADWMTQAIAERVLKTARVTARLYRLQLEEIEF